MDLTKDRQTDEWTGGRKDGRTDGRTDWSKSKIFKRSHHRNRWRRLHVHILLASKFLFWKIKSSKFDVIIGEDQREAACKQIMFKTKKGTEKKIIGKWYWSSTGQHNLGPSRWNSMIKKVKSLTRLFFKMFYQKQWEVVMILIVSALLMGSSVREHLFLYLHIDSMNIEEQVKW